MGPLINSLLTLTSLVDTFAGLGPVKKHLFQASRELLLAIQGLLTFADQQVTNVASSAEQQKTIRGAIAYAQNAIRTISNQLPRVDEKEYQALHHKVIRSILDVLEVELKKNEILKNQKAKMKVEVYQAIRNVLLKELYDREKGHDSAA